LQDQSLIDHIYCDVLFASFLRYLNSTYLFAFINEDLYNYQRHDQSITGQIEKHNLSALTTDKYEYDFAVYIAKLNRHIENHLNYIKENLFMGVIFKKSFSSIFQLSLSIDGKYIDKIDQKLLEECETYYNHILNVCKALFEQSF
jgi:hypothetical protein